MINIVIWSKDRAAQLDLTLKGFKNSFKEWHDQKVNIIYTYSSPLFKAGYDLVKSFHPEFNWVLETNFRQDTLKQLFDNNLEFCSFLVDDDVFIGKFSINDPEFQLFLSNDKYACLSPRLAPYVNYCYPAQQNQLQPTFIPSKILSWDWTQCTYDWGYPASVASMHIYRKTDLEFIKSLNFRGANSLEGAMEGSFSRSKKLMICYKQAKCICSTNNKVQNENANYNANSHPVDSLNAGLLNGKRLDENINNNYVINMCHGPISLRWKVDNAI